MRYLSRFVADFPTRLRVFRTHTTIFIREVFSTLGIVLLPIVLVFALSHAQVSAQCIDYTDYLHTVAIVSTPRYPDDVAISGTHAYVVGSDNSSSGVLQVIDITRPQGPSILGSVNVPPGVTAVAVSGHFAYVTAVLGPGGVFHVIDITNPQSPAIVGTVNTPRPIVDVAVSGTHAYVACNDVHAGLQVIDITNPLGPTIVGSVGLHDADTPCVPKAIAISGTYAYVAVDLADDSYSGGGLQVIDITDPQAPRILASLIYNCDPYDVALSDTHVYVADSKGIKAIDISTPSTPYIVSSVETHAFAVAVSGTHAYVAGGSPTLHVVDITSPQHLQIVGSLTTQGQHNYGVAISGAYAYVAAWQSGLQVIDITNPQSPQILGSVDTSDYSGAVAISGTRAYVADGSSGLHVIDITNPQSPQIIGSVDTPGFATGVAISDTHAYVADYWASHLISAIQVIDITNPQSPQIVGSVETLPGDSYCNSNSLTILGTYLYAADYSNGLQVIDITDPQNLHTICRVDTPGRANGVAISGNHAYVADEYSGLQVIDITNPQSPHIIGQVDTPGSYSLGVAISGTHAYVADRFSGLQVIDIADPQRPRMVASVPGRTAGVTISGTYAYVIYADGESALQVIDIANPQDPKIVGGVNMPGFARGVAISGVHAYVANGSSGLQVLPLQCDDVTSVLLSSLTLTSYDQIVEIRWTLSTNETDAEFYLTASRGDEHWDVPSIQQSALQFVAFDRSPKLADGGDVVYQLFYRGSAETWRKLAEQSIALATNPTFTPVWSLYPNPAPERVLIAFSSGRPGYARLTVHDVIGREVGRVFEGWLRPGAVQWSWSAQDTRGHRLPAGVYVARLQTEQGVHARKLVLVD